MNSDIIGHSGQSMYSNTSLTRNLTEPGKKWRIFYSQLWIYIYLIFETSVKRRKKKEWKKEGRKERKQKSQQISRHNLNIATSLKVKWSDRSTRDVSLRFCMNTVLMSRHLLELLLLHRWDISLFPHQMGFISRSPAGLPSTSQLHHAPKTTHNWHNLPLPPLATQWHSKYRGKGAFKSLFFYRYYNNSLIQSGTFTKAAEQKVKVLVEASPVPVFPFSDNYSALHVFRKANYSW